jgi:hypothetical protein
MSFIRIKAVNGKAYFYLVESQREGRKVRQLLIRYFGRNLPKAYLTKKLQDKIRLI